MLAKYAWPNRAACPGFMTIGFFCDAVVAGQTLALVSHGQGEDAGLVGGGEAVEVAFLVGFEFGLFLQ